MTYLREEVGTKSYIVSKTVKKPDEMGCTRGQNEIREITAKI